MCRLFKIMGKIRDEKNILTFCKSCIKVKSVNEIEYMIYFFPRTVDHCVLFSGQCLSNGTALLQPDLKNLLLPTFAFSTVT